MSKKQDEDKLEVFAIPNNFIDEGKILGGTFRTRNAIEAALILCAVVYPIFNFTSLSIKTKIVLAIFIGGPLAVLALFGVNDGSLTEFASDFTKFFFQKKEIELQLFEGEQSTEANKKTEKFKNSGHNSKKVKNKS